jgi:ribosome assembly protein 4
MVNQDQREANISISTVIAQLKSENGESAGPVLQLPIDITTDQLEELLNELFKQQSSDKDSHEHIPYSFYVNDTEIIDNLSLTLQLFKHSTETQVDIVYRPQAIFRIRSVTRCSSSMAGHTEAILSVAFSPDGTQLASGSGDTTVRLWDILTGTPYGTLDKVHTHWIQCIAWSPDGQWLISGSMDNMVQIWDPRKGEPVGSPLKGHTKWITSIAWEPLHM